MSRHAITFRATDKRGNSIQGVSFKAYPYTVGASWYSRVEGQYVVDEQAVPASVPFFTSDDENDSGTAVSLTSGEDGYPTSAAFLSTGDYVIVGTVAVDESVSRTFIIPRYSAGVTEQPPFTGVLDFRYPDAWDWRPEGLRLWKSGERWYCDESEYVARFFDAGVLSDVQDGSVAWIATGGNDLAPGTFADPMETIAAAISSGANNIRVMPGIYYGSFTSQLFSKDVSIVCPSGRARFVAGTAGHMHLWEDMTAGVYRADVDHDYTEESGEIFDELLRDERGYPGRLQRVDTLGECFSTAGTWFPGDSENLYVHRVDDSQPDELLMILPNVGGASTTSTVSIYLKNVTFYGGSGGAFWYRPSSAQSMLYADNVGFMASHKYGGLRLQGGNAVLRDCAAGMNIQDGLNYHDLNDVVCSIVEIDSVAHVPSYAGHLEPATVNQNASTGHDEIRIIRVGGVYSGARADVVSDVNSAASLNLGIQSISRSETEAAFNATNDAPSFVIDGRLEGVVSINQGETSSLLLDENTKVTGAILGDVQRVPLAEMSSGVSSVSSFSPPSLPNNGVTATAQPADVAFEAWLDSHVVVAELDARKNTTTPDNGEVVSVWDNGGTSTTDFAASGDVVYRAYLNGYGGPVLDLSAGSTLTSSGWVQAQPSLVIVIGQFGTFEGMSRLFANADDSTDRQELFVDPNISKYRAYSGSSLQATPDADLKRHTHAVMFDGASSSVWIDGVKTTGNALTDDMSGLTIGSDSDGNRQSNPIIAYAAVITGIIDDADILEGLTLASAYASHRS